MSEPPGEPDPRAAAAHFVRLSFRAAPVHVRTARLVAVTVARRAGWSEDLVESVRQAVGEACALALRAAAGGEHVTLELDDSGRQLTARVWPVPDVPTSEDDVLPRAVVVGLTDEASFERYDGHAALRLSWRPRPDSLQIRDRIVLPHGWLHRYSP